MLYDETWYTLTAPYRLRAALWFYIYSYPTHCQAIGNSWLTIFTFIDL